MHFLHQTIKKVNVYLPHTNHWCVLVASVPVALATGTLFVYSVYGTQLAEACHLHSSQAANLNISATIGTAVGGVVSGIITDIYGTQIPILSSCLALSIGYWWLYHSYQLGAESSMTLLILAMFLIGIGSVSGYFSSIKAVTLNFPNYKGSAQSVTIALFAISSLLYSFVASKVLKGDVGAFLCFLYVSCGLMLFVGFVFIRIDGYIDHEEVPRGSEAEVPPPEEQPLLVTVTSHSLKNKSLLESVLHPIFWIHYLILSVVQGLGQMYIYSVGFIVKAMVYHYVEDPHGSGHLLNELQAWHVSLIAVFSFLGRLSSGPQADYLVNKLHYQRHWILIWGLTIMFLGHLLNTIPNTWVTDLTHMNRLLLVASCLIGYAYGFSFTCYPAIIADLFNMKNYSFVWGIMYTSTTLGLTVMTKLFGRIYDANSTNYDKIWHEFTCTKGSGCYRRAFEYTSLFSLVAMAMTLGYIYYRRLRN